jgi:type VI protein secretion system component VasK
VQAAVRALLLAPTRWAKGVATRGAAGDLAAALKSVCEQVAPLEGRYPLDPRSIADVPPRDVKTVLHPENGTLWALVEEQMGAFVKRQGSAWVAVSGGPAVPASFLRFLTRAAHLADALFPSGAAQPQVTLAVDGVTIPAHAEFVTLTVNGKTARFDDDKKHRSASFGEVGMSTPNAEARLVVHYPKRQQLVLSSQHGPWAALRLPHSADTWRDYAGGGNQAGWTGVDLRGAPVTVTMVVRTSEAGAALRPEQFGTEPLRCRPP